MHELATEFTRQIDTLIIKAYPQKAGITNEEFLDIITPLKEKLADLSLPEVDFVHGKLPFVIVITSQLVPSEMMMSLVEKDNKPGVTKLYPRVSTDFTAIPDEKIPDGKAYLLLNIDRGKDLLNVTPYTALEMIRRANHHSLTIDEGIALVTHYPQFLRKNNCFSLLASRHARDKRVPAIWINGEKQPHLGWCWENNPHTWLGSAFAYARVGR